MYILASAFRIRWRKLVEEFSPWDNRNYVIHVRLSAKVSSAFETWGSSRTLTHIGATEADAHHFPDLQMA